MSDIAYTVGERRPIADIEPIAAEPGLLESLQQFGLAYYRHSTSTQLPIAMAATCIKQTLDQSRTSPSDVDVLMLATSTLEFGRIENTELLQLSERYGLTNATPIGVSAAECANFGTALHLARLLVATGEARNVLLVTTDYCDVPTKRLLREVYSIVSDGAASCLVTAEPSRIELLATATATNQLIRAASNPNAIAALTRRAIAEVVDEVLTHAATERTQVQRVIMNNLNENSLRIMTAAAGFDHNMYYPDNIADYAHVHSADNLINLQTYLDDGIPPNQNVLTISHAFGTWAPAVLHIQ
ncbi:hypothetical protein [Nocardia nova]|uniref:hypothetical protein n=1 Tax=Nocardia nova TaxID=37330 RepID=UPI0033FE8A82